jgi:hypothetical protein
LQQLCKSLQRACSPGFYGNALSELKFFSTPTQVNKTIGDAATVTIRCVVMGRPHPLVRWTHDGHAYAGYEDNTDTVSNTALNPGKIVRHLNEKKEMFLK